MKPRVLALSSAVLALALAAVPAAAQRHPSGGGSSSGSSGGSSGGSGGGGAVHSGGGSSGGGGGATAAPRPSGGSGGGSVYSGGGSTPSSGGYRGTAVPRGARPNGGSASGGSAVERAYGPYAPGRSGGYGSGYRNYRSSNYIYNPYWLYGYGAIGMGYLYYDPFWWGYGYPGYYGYYGDPDSWYYGPGSVGGYGGYDGGYGYYGDGGYRRGNGPQGGLKLKVSPSTAEVYVDGYYMGIVDDYDGVFQQLALDAGVHRIEVKANGLVPLSFEVKIEPRDVITYRGELQPIR
jgi:hypothetical protein